jgi:cytochrome c-type biogenesis protein CcmE
MKPRTKFLIGAGLVLATAGYLMASSISETGMYYVTPTELTNKVAADPSLHGVGVKLGARVVPGSIKRAAGGREYAFVVTDGARQIPVQYRGIAPDTFTDGVDVVVEGRLGQDGTFHATTLLAKCASRYESAPEKYRDTPGYKAAASRA